MDEYKVIKYSKLNKEFFWFRRNGSISCSRFRNTTRSLQKQLACFRTDTNGPFPVDYIRHVCQRNGCVNYPSTKLFISSDLHIPRDLFRRTGYQLVKAPESADAVIIPNIETAQFQYYQLAYLDKQDNSLHLLLMQDETYRDQSARVYTEEELQKAKDYITIKYGLTEDAWIDTSLKQKSVSFLPKVKEYEDILLNLYPHLKDKYIMDSSVSIQSLTEINMETLEIWRRSEDRQMLMKAIIGSNFREYPMTVCTLIKLFHNELGRWSGNSAFDTMLKNIGYVWHQSLKEMFANFWVSPKDWNMLQQFLLRILSVDEKGGIADKRVYAKYSEISALLPTALVVKPLEINDRMDFKTIGSMINNS